ncbi:MAG: 50S ribosomal protein L11 methyltransferase [Burkholderiaceae bacterium]
MSANPSSKKAIAWQLEFSVSLFFPHEAAAEQWLGDWSDGLMEEGAISMALDETALCILLPLSLDPLSWWASQKEQVSGLALQGQPAVSKVYDEDWVRTTQAQFEPMVIAETLWLGPSWHEVPERFRQPPRRALTIDPGLAFGTGSHATTQLCLEAIASLLASSAWPVLSQGKVGRSRRILDYGCGSGVLGLAWAVLADANDEVLGLDIDPVAVTTAQENARLNGLENRTRFVNADACIVGPFDLVLANILAQPLKVLAPVLVELAANGQLVLAGLLDRQAEELVEVYSEVSQGRCQLEAFGQRDGWTCLWKRPTDTTRHNDERTSQYDQRKA